MPYPLLLLKNPIDGLCVLILLFVSGFIDLFIDNPVSGKKLSLLKNVPPVITIDPFLWAITTSSGNSAYSISSTQLSKGYRAYIPLITQKPQKHNKNKTKKKKQKQKNKHKTNTKKKKTKKKHKATNIKRNRQATRSLHKESNWWIMRADFTFVSGFIDLFIDNPVSGKN